MDRINMSEKWEYRFMRLAFHVSEWSKDPSTKVGAVITKGRHVVGMGYNGFPKGTMDDESIYLDRPVKYLRVVHAESNALIQAGKVVSSITDPLTMYSTLCPCSTCAGMAINAGIRHFVTMKPTDDQMNRWGDSFLESINMIQEAEIQITYLDSADI